MNGMRSESSWSRLRFLRGIQEGCGVTPPRFSSNGVGYMVSAGSGEGSVRSSVPPVIPGVTPAPMQRVADATQVTADPTQPRANYSSPPASHPQGPPLALWPRFAFQGRPDAIPRGSRAGRSVLKAPLGQAKRRRDVVPEDREAGEGDELDLQSFLEGVSEDDPELLRIMPSFTMPSFGALRTVEDADRARAAASSDSALDLL